MQIHFSITLSERESQDSVCFPVLLLVAFMNGDCPPHAHHAVMINTLSAVTKNCLFSC